MNEVSVVSTLIARLVGIAIALGAAGTLVDHVFVVKNEARKSVIHGGISYLKWNKALVEKKTKTDN